MSLLYNSPTANAGTGSLQSNAIEAQRDPTINDTLYTIGQIWVNVPSQEVFFLVGFEAGQAVWIGTSAGTGTFTSLTVDPGPTELHGILTVDGNIDTPGVITLNADGGPTETIVIQSTQGTSNNAIELDAVEGGIEIGAHGVGTPVLISSEFGAVNIVSGEDSQTAIVVQADGGTSSGILIENTTGTGDAGTVTTSAIGILATDGAIYIRSEDDVNAAIVLDASSGGTNAGLALLAQGPLNLDASGASVGLVSISADGVSAQAIHLEATDAAGGILIEAGTDGVNFSTTGDIILTSSSDITIDPATTLIMAPDATVTTIELGNVTPTVNRTSTLSGGAVTSAHTDTLNLATGGVNTDAGATKTVNIATGANLLGSTNVNIATGTAASGAKTVTIGNIDSLTTINALGVAHINTAGTGATVIGSTATGGNIDLKSAGTIIVDSADALATAVVVRATGAGGGISIAPTNTTAQIDVGNVVPTVARTTNVNVGTVATAVADTLNLATGATSTNAGASKTVNIGTGNNLLGTTTVNVATGTTASGTKTVNIGNADGLSAVNALGVVHVNTSGPGATTIGNAAAGGAIALTTNTAVSIDAKTASYYKVTGAADLTLQSTAGSVVVSGGEAVADAIQLTAPSGGVSISGGAAATLGNIGLVNQQQAAAAGPSATVTVVNNSRIGSVTFTGYTQAAAATLVLTLTNSFITATSPIIATAMNAGTNDAQMQITRIKQGSGTADITIKNQGAAALNGDMVLSYIILS